MKIKYFFFDLGKVMLEFDHDRGCQQVAQVAGISSEKARQAMFDSGLEVDFEKGMMTPSEFATRFNELSGGQCENAELFEAMSDIFTPNEPVLNVVRQLARQGKALGVLSNTCWAHWEFVCRNYSFIHECFPDWILSYEVGAMKPDPKIYKAAIAKAGVEPGEIFFVDDRDDNVRGAIEAGLDAVLYQSAEVLISALDNRGVSTTL